MSGVWRALLLASRASGCQCTLRRLQQLPSTQHPSLRTHAKLSERWRFDATAIQ